MITLPVVLSISALMFAAGLFMVLSRTNMVAMLMGIELLLNAGALNFAAFAFFGGNVEGYVMALFIIALAAMESVAALAIIFTIFRSFRTANVDRASALRG